AVARARDEVRRLELRAEGRGERLAAHGVHRVDVRNELRFLAGVELLVRPEQERERFGIALLLRRRGREQNGQESRPADLDHAKYTEAAGRAIQIPYLARR